MTIWRLKTGADRRVRSGHPWVFSNELSASPKGHSPGAPVELVDAKGAFVARGYGNPHSLIAFRALSFAAQIDNPLSHDELHKKILKSWQLRRDLGFLGSFRLCFGESDFIPGLVIDYYRLEQAQVFVAQILTAGMSVALVDLEGFFQGLAAKAKEQKLSQFDWDKTAVVIRNDVNIRKLEGMTIDKPLTLKSIAGVDLSKADIVLNKQDQGTLLMRCDLAEGQKTGFFLDQTQNIYQAVHLFKNWAQHQPKRKIKVLDLCCYVGHWSTQIAAALTELGMEVETHLVDVSKPALAFAKFNAERAGAQAEVHELDVLEKLGGLPGQQFDIVIADPPAFIKAKKDIPTGKHAYLKMNTQAFRLVKQGGFVVSCSCSGLLNEEDLREAVRKSAVRNFLEVRNVTRGGHAADHPTLMAFPEGFYLKMFTHYVL